LSKLYCQSQEKERNGASLAFGVKGIDESYLSSNSHKIKRKCPSHFEGHCWRIQEKAYQSFE